MTACIRGCTLRGQHTADCATECAGCLPRPAVEGLLCAWDYTRLIADLEDIPPLIRHLRDLGQPNAGLKPGDGRSHGDPAYHIPIPAEWTTADELHNLLVGWVRVVVEEHPAGLTGPDDGGTWWTRSRLEPDEDGAYVVERKPAGIRTGSGKAVVRWLLPHMPWVAAQEWVGEMRADVGREVATAKARWPMEERGHHVPAPCPRCDGLTLWYSPPAWAGASMRVECLSPDCGRVFSEPEWDRMRGLMVMAAGKAG